MAQKPSRATIIERRANQARLRDFLLERHGARCAICGISNDAVPLELAHIHPISRVGNPTLDKITLLCSNCHRAFDRQPREVEFSSFLGALLQENTSFTEVQQETVVGSHERLRVDILAKRRHPSGDEPLLIECKTAIALGAERVESILRQIRNYSAHLPEARPVLAVPTTLSEEQRRAFVEAGIEVWDLGTLADVFADQLPREEASYYGNLLLDYLLRTKKKRREEELSERLSMCKPGQRDWFLYQSLVGEILEQLFYPPLSKPIPEHSDKPKVNRRDFVIPNYADSGFWAFLRTKYQADYVVVDAKNYGARVRKEDVLQLANYLKPHGAGLVGMIYSRHGGDQHGCEHTLREQWVVHQKLILVLSDEDLLAMLAAKSEQRGPEEVLAARIQEFRLSM